MAKTVIEAFEIFLKDIVNLDKGDSKQAKSSRDWLVSQILNFPDEEKSEFPFIYTDKNIFYGSFERKTKKRPLDDIDIMICLTASGGVYYEYSDRIEIQMPDEAKRLKKLCNDNTNILNSKKVINLFVSKLSSISQYKKAVIKRNQEAATIELQSHDWDFDVVPCFFTEKDVWNKTYYLIPDGNGNWKKTDPRLDRERILNVNKSHNGNVLDVIRTVKFWNQRPTMPTIGSYLLENLILDYYDEKTTKALSYVDMEIVDVFFDLHARIYKTVNDPKNIQGNINNLSTEDRDKIYSRAYADYSKAFDARKLEKEKKEKESINKWREIFGDDFPKYTG